jgi:hypothetical protein
MVPYVGPKLTFEVILFHHAWPSGISALLIGPTLPRVRTTATGRNEARRTGIYPTGNWRISPWGNSVARFKDEILNY